MLPNFICPGAQRSATTTLNAILRQHPDIYVPNIKETNFFGTSSYNKGIDWYEKNFYTFKREVKMAGDISANYLHVNNVPKRIYNSLGKDIKFIFMLRNPIERAYSHYLMERARCVETEKDFINAINREKSAIHKGYYGGYIGRGMYARHIRNFLKYFPKESMHFEIYEHFINNTYERISEILKFLGLPMDSRIDCNIKKNPTWEPRSRLISFVIHKMIRNKISYMPRFLRYLDVLNHKKSVVKRPIENEAVKELSMIYKEDVDELETIIDRDLSIWRETWM